jgi:hypothetical protein
MRQRAPAARLADDQVQLACQDSDEHVAAVHAPLGAGATAGRRTRGTAGSHKGNK